MPVRAASLTSALRFGSILAPQRRFATFTLVFLCIALGFGGATHGDVVSSAVVRLTGILLLGLAVWRIVASRQPPRAQAAIWLLCGVVALPLLQLIPLPPEVWTRLPGRAFLVADYRSAGVVLPWLPTSLAPRETADVLLWLIPPAAMFLATLTLDARDRGRMALTVPLFAMAAVALGMMQMAGGPESPLRLYTETNIDSAVGFFANRNHQAALLVAAAALAPLWITAFRQTDRQLGRFGLFLAFAIELVLIVGLGVTQSRAGVLLAVPALAISVIIVSRVGKGVSGSALALLAATIVGAGLVGAFALSGLMERFREPLSSDARLHALPAIERAARSFSPVGSGLGSFDPVYRMFEPPGALSMLYLNHAHNDGLEIWLEAGALGLLLIIAFLLWWGWTTVRLWRGRRDKYGDGVRATASLVIGLLLAHSTVDYPLRTAALATLFALACGLLAAPDDPARRPVVDRERRRERLKRPDSLASRPRLV